MRHAILCLPLLLVLAGCNRDPVTEVPGHQQPGPSIEVARETLGSGNGSGADGMTIGSTPSIDWDAPNIPVMQDGQVDVVWFVPVESRDGESLRDAHYVYIKVAEQSFTLGHANNQKTLLNDEENVPRTDMLPASAKLQQRTMDVAPPLPTAATQTTQTRVTVVDVDPNSGQSNVVGTATVPGSPVPPGRADASTEAVNRMIENFNAANAARANTAHPGQPADQAPTGTTPVQGAP